MENKFKVGDRVRVISNADGSGKFVGEVGNVLSINNAKFFPYPYEVDFDDVIENFGKNELELFIDKKENKPTLEFILKEIRKIADSITLKIHKDSICIQVFDSSANVVIDLHKGEFELNIHLIDNSCMYFTEKDLLDLYKICKLANENKELFLSLRGKDGVK